MKILVHVKGDLAKGTEFVPSLSPILELSPETWFIYHLSTVESFYKENHTYGQVRQLQQKTSALLLIGQS